VTGGIIIYQTQAGPDATEPERISDVECLRKMSLDLTYQGPTEQDVADLESGAATLADMADRYMAGDEFAAVVFDWYRQQFPQTETSPTDIDYEEPSRIAQYVVVGDRDYREVLTGDYTVGGQGDTGTVTDRPPAGVLTTQHYMSAYTGSFRRNWAGHFLKEWAGILLEPVTLPPEDEARDLSPDSLLTDPACSFCHANETFGVDFLAAFSQCYDEQGVYTPDCTEDNSGTFLLESGAGIQELGQIVAASNEFKSTTVNLFYKRLFGRLLAVQEAEFYSQAARELSDSGYSAKALIRFLVTSDQYCSN